LAKIIQLGEACHEVPMEFSALSDLSDCASHVWINDKAVMIPIDTSAVDTSIQAVE